MSRNYDNWERLVAAVLKKEQIWQLCHQDSVSTIYSDYSSSRLDFTLPISLGSSGIADTFDFIRPLEKGMAGSGSTYLVKLVQDVAVWDQIYVGKGTQAVVKSMAGYNITEDEFEQYMAVIGRHENVGTPWAYCFSQGTKLIVYDYYSQGSVSDMLRGSRKTSPQRPNWESRLRIAIGAARGVAYIHEQWGGEMVHGNIKSSNVYLNKDGYGCVTDFGLVMVGILKRGNAGALASQKSDVYSFGRVLFKIFTRALPMQEMDINDHIRSFEPYEWDLWNFNLGMLLVDELDMWEERTRLYVDGEVLSSVKEEEFRRMMDVAKRCLASVPGDRLIEDGANFPLPNERK